MKLLFFYGSSRSFCPCPWASAPDHFDLCPWASPPGPPALSQAPWLPSGWQGIDCDTLGFSMNQRGPGVGEYVLISVVSRPLPLGLAMALGGQHAPGPARSSWEALPEASAEDLVLPELASQEEHAEDTEALPVVPAADSGLWTPPYRDALRAQYEQRLDEYARCGVHPYGWRQPGRGYLGYPMRQEDVNANTFEIMLDMFQILSRGEVQWRLPAESDSQHFQAMLSCLDLGNVTFGITKSKQKSKDPIMRAMGQARVYIQGAVNICAVQRRILVALKMFSEDCCAGVDTNDAWCMNLYS